MTQMTAFSQLKWRCRRGTKELDYLLESFLEKKFDLAGEEEQLLFIELLALQDTQLIFYLLGEQVPDSKGLARLVKKIRDNSSISNQAI
jgi:antitoxin CptB